MKKVIFCALFVGAIVFNGCKKDDDNAVSSPVVISPDGCYVCTGTLGGTNLGDYDKVCDGDNGIVILHDGENEESFDLKTVNQALTFQTMLTVGPSFGINCEVK